MAPAQQLSSPGVCCAACSPVWWQQAAATALPAPPRPRASLCLIASRLLGSGRALAVLPETALRQAAVCSSSQHRPVYRIALMAAVCLGAPVWTYQANASSGMTVLEIHCRTCHSECELRRAAAQTRPAAIRAPKQQHSSLCCAVPWVHPECLRHPSCPSTSRPAHLQAGTHP